VRVRFRSVAILLLLQLPWIVACAAEPEPLAKEFKDYWFAGLAELDRYELSQSRYGQLVPGDAVLIFVTEDFLPGKQVKADSSDRAVTGAVPVMKVNFTKKFTTGIYPYSVMTSSFLPLDAGDPPRVLKVTSSVQEWCGHVFSQMNLRNNRFQVRSFSYFETEGDRDETVEAAMAEDGIWGLIRLDPDRLPTGELRMIPGAEYRRLKHRPAAVETVVAELNKPDGGLWTYRLHYPDSGRTLEIDFQPAFPHIIEGWREIDGLTTTAVRTHTVRNAYWEHHSPADRPMREKLGLR
jgi:hypothetical protein